MAAHRKVAMASPALVVTGRIEHASASMSLVVLDDREEIVAQVRVIDGHGVAVE